ncbi:MAG: hypothetical protein K0R48_1000 [Gammaproteobacteria bacterium]|jgi:hypothetical protein|nr:hypothetical protein [Gammaproteobacteria bacterium]
MAVPPTKEITVVLGSGRSGTSIITKALQTLGCFLGDNLSPADSVNPKGFFEDHQIVYEINEKILARLGYAWHSLTPFDFSLPSLTFTDLEDNAQSILTKKFKHTQWCGFKDPRTSRLLPFWQPLFKKMALKDSYIIALRNPLSSVASFEKYDQIKPNKGFLLWLMHLLPAIENTLGKSTLIVSYEEMLLNPNKQLERMHAKLNVSKPLEEATIAEYKDSFLDQTLFRNKYSYEEFKTHPEVPLICIKLYNLLNLVALDKLAFESDEFRTQWADIFLHYNSFAGDFLERLTLLTEQNFTLQRKVSEQEQMINSLLSSFSWRLTAPLRKISSYLCKT